MRERLLGIWIGTVAAFLVAGFVMVQLRCKLGSYPCGDWPQHGYTWHFWPAFALPVGLWVAGALVWRHRLDVPIAEALERIGRASAPLLGLIVAWAWYGLTGSAFHAPACDTPVLCHDTTRFAVVYWSAPWATWAAWSVWRATTHRP